MDNCIFCKIRDKVINSKIYFENENFFVIGDIAPKAKKHYLFIPKNHYKLLEDTNQTDRVVLAEMLSMIPKLQKELGLEGGFRVIINQDDNGGQEVNHLHIHVLGGEKLPNF